MSTFLDNMKASMADLTAKAKGMFTKTTGVNPSTDLKPEGAAPEGAGRTITGGKRHRSQKRTHRHRRPHKKFKKTHKRR